MIKKTFVRASAMILLRKLALRGATMGRESGRCAAGPSHPLLRPHSWGPHYHRSNTAGKPAARTTVRSAKRPSRRAPRRPVVLWAGPNPPSRTARLPPGIRHVVFLALSRRLLLAKEILNKAAHSLVDRLADRGPVRVR